MIVAFDVDRTVADAIAIRERWEPLLPRRCGDFTRTRIFCRPDFEVLALLWSPASSTPIHDHGGSYCATRILRGELSVARYYRIDDFADPQYARIIFQNECVQRTGEGDALNGERDLHRVCNSASDEALSIHLYTPRLTAFQSFDIAGRITQVGSSSYDAILDL